MCKLLVCNDRVWNLFELLDIILKPLQWKGIAAVVHSMLMQ